jgi:Protein of unknown function (DUF3631)
MHTQTMLEKLRNRDESPWNDIRGRPLTDRGLASRLKPYRIKSKPVRIGEHVAKGYYALDFNDAWRRYPPLGEVKVTKVAEVTKLINKNKGVTFVTSVTSRDGKEAVWGRDVAAETISHLYPDDLPGLDETEALEEDYPELPAMLDRRGKL